jgi:hypothetical protein
MLDEDVWDVGSCPAWAGPDWGMLQDSSTGSGFSKVLPLRLVGHYISHRHERTEQIWCEDVFKEKEFSLSHVIISPVKSYPLSRLYRVCPADLPTSQIV